MACCWLVGGMYVASPWLSLLAPVQSLGAGRRRWLRVQRQSQRALFATVEVGAGGVMVTTPGGRGSRTRAGRAESCPRSGSGMYLSRRDLPTIAQRFNVGNTRSALHKSRRDG